MLGAALALSVVVMIGMYGGAVAMVPAYCRASGMGREEYVVTMTVFGILAVAAAYAACLASGSLDTSWQCALCVALLFVAGHAAYTVWLTTAWPMLLFAAGYGLAALGMVVRLYYIFFEHIEVTVL